jgi:hypothetical protein
MTLSSPPEESVRDTADRAGALVEEGRHDEAMAVIDQAAEEVDHPVFVFMRGVIEQDRANCEAAIAHFEAFVALDVPAVDAADAARRRDACRARLGTPSDEEVVATPVPAPRPEPPVASPSDLARRSEPDRSPVVRAPSLVDPAGITLLVGGALSLGVGAGLLAKARADERSARRADNVWDYDRLASRAESVTPWGIATASVGGALILAGVVRYAVIGARRRASLSRATTTKLRWSGTTGMLSF